MWRDKHSMQQQAVIIHRIIPFLYTILTMSLHIFCASHANCTKHTFCLQKNATITRHQNSMFVVMQLYVTKHCTECSRPKFQAEILNELPNQDYS